MIALAAIIPSGVYQLGLALVIAVSALFLFTSGTKKILAVLTDKRFFIPASIWILVVAATMFSDNKSEALSSLSVYLPFALIPFGTFATDEYSIRQIEHILSAFICGLCLSLLYCDVYSLVSIIKTGQTTIVENGVYSYHKF
ncbi:MAG: hypothetical protein EOP48_18140, partial [Sphingobacteriales bacterium]